MPFAEFLQGYGKAILRLALVAGDFSLIRRDIEDGELSDDTRTVLFGGLAAFWATYGADIEAQAPPPGLTASSSWHAGRELAHVRMRKKSFDPNDWRTVVRNRMTNDALAMRLVRIRFVAGQITAEEFDG